MADTKTTITSEAQYIDKLSNINNTGITDFTLLSEDTKNSLDKKKDELYEFLKNNTKDDDTFLSAIEIWNQYKDIVKNGKCTFQLNNLEIKMIDSKLHMSVDYTAETIFYGLHLKKNFVDLLPRIKGDDFKNNNIEITFSNSIALYHVLSTLKIRGLNKENFAFANVMFKLAEISKVYQHYDNISLTMSQDIGKWSMGLDKESDNLLKDEIEKTIVAEEQA